MLVLDDFLLNPMNDVERRDLLEVIEDRYASIPAPPISRSALGSFSNQCFGEPLLSSGARDAVARVVAIESIAFAAVHKPSPAKLACRVAYPTATVKAPRRRDAASPQPGLR